MAQYDGSIRISTGIDIKGFKDGEKEIESESRRLANSVSNSTQEAEKEVEHLGQTFSDTAVKIAELQTKMELLKNQKIPTEEYTTSTKEVKNLEKALENAYTRKEKFLETGGDESSRTFKGIEYDIEKLEQKLKFAEQSVKNLVDSGKAFTLGSDTEQFAKYEAQMQRLQTKREKEIEIENQKQEKLQEEAAEEERIAQIRENAVVGNQRIIETVERIKQLEQEIADLKAAERTEGYADYDNRIQELTALKQEVRDYNNGIEETKKKYIKLGQIAQSALSTIGSTMKKAAVSSFRFLKKEIKKAASAILSFGKSTKNTNNILGSGFKNILKYGLGIRSLYALINKLRTAIKEGFTNLYNGSETFKNTVDQLKASALTLKNTFAAAFRPLVEVAIPYIKKLLDYMTQAVNAAGQLMAALFGRKTYTKAIKQTTAALKEETKAQSKQLSSLDKLNNLTSQQDTGGDNGAGGMFEEVPISDKWKNIADWLKDMWDKANFYDLGKLLGEKLKEALDNIPWNKIKETARKIGKSIASFINGFIEVEGLGYSIGKTLVEAINTGFEFLNAFVHELHWGSVGKFIAETINGFFENIDWDLIYDTFITGAKGLGDAINSFADNLNWEAISTAVSNIVNTFVDTLYTFFNTVDWENLGKKVGKFISDSLAGINWENLGIMIGTGFQSIFDFLLNVIENIEWGKIGTYIGTSLNGVVRSLNLSSLGKILGETLTGAFDLAINFASTFDWKALGDNIAGGINGFFEKFDGAKFAQSATALLSGLLDTIIETVQTIDWSAVWRDIIDFLVNVDWLELNNKIWKACFDLISGITLGLAKAIVETDWVKVWNDILQAFKDFFGIHSPSTVMKEMGGYIVAGLLNGLKEKWNDIVSWITEKIQWLKEKFSGMASSVKSAFSGGSSGGGLFSKSRSSIQQAFAPATYAVNPAFAALKTAEIPRLATGAVIPANREFLAVLGDQKHGTNVEAPLEMIEQANKKSLLEVFSELGITGGGNRDQAINLNLTVECEGYQLLHLMQKLNSEYFKQHRRYAFT